MWTDKLFLFLEDLKANNDKAWFQENKPRYEGEARDPALRFVETFAPKLEAISPHFVADPRPVGGSLFRIYRDTRFSSDKTPYKTHLGLQFRHEDGKDAHCPCFYLHLEPGEVFGGSGLWHPDADSLNRVREAMVAWPGRWSEVMAGLKAHKLSLGGDSLKRPPKGYDPDHPLIEDLKRKDFVAMRSFSRSQASKADFVSQFVKVCQDTAPLVGFLCDALKVPF